MKKVILFSLLAIVLTSCGTAPQEKYDIAKHCVDSLYQAGIGNSIEYNMLREKMTNVDERMTVELSKLFKKYYDVEKILDEVILESRKTDVNNVGYTKVALKPIITTVNNKSNTIKLEVELTFDVSQDPLKIASDVDDVIRRNAGSNAKLINVKIIQ